MSVKSVNDECFEKSCSMKSGSEESLLCGEHSATFDDGDEEESLSQQLLDALTPAALSQLRRAFRKTRARAQDMDRRVDEVMRLAAAAEGVEFAAAPAHAALALSLDRDGFLRAVNKIFGDRKYEPHAAALFSRLDAWGAGRVWWRQLLDRLLDAPSPRWTPLDATVRRLAHCKREMIVKLVPIETRVSFCYAAVSKGGRVGLYDAHFKLLHSYEVFFDRFGVHKRVKNRWITDAVYMSDVQNLLLAASDRSLTVYDASTLAHNMTYCITGLPHIPTCVAYAPSRVRGGSELALGTARGDITRMRFLQPRLGLLPAAGDHVSCYFWMELSSPPHKAYCSVTTWRRVHARAVRRVCYSGDVVFSCSHDSGVSVRARHAPGKLDDYVFKVQRGVTCFHVVPALHLLATGSPDGAVRLWDTTQSTPFARLAAPGRAAVLDVKVIADMEVVVAYCSNCWLHVWDLNEETLLQTLKIKFPFLGVLGKKVEFGAYCIHPGPALQIEEPDSPPSWPGSSVVRSRSGGLQLMEEEDPPRDLTDTDYSRSCRGALLVTSGDCACAARLPLPAQRAPRPPPAARAAARRPRAWDLPPPYGDALLGDTEVPLLSAEDCSAMVIIAPAQSPPPPPPAPAAPAHSAPPTTEDVDKLLEDAGLKGILEKDFVLMNGLKHDLNMKLAEMEMDRPAMQRAPHRALRALAAPAPAPAGRWAHAYERCMRLFPPPSTAPTPTDGSAASTPRRSRSRSSSKT